MKQTMKERITITIEWREGEIHCIDCPFENFQGWDKPCKKCITLNKVKPMHPVILPED